MVYQTDAYRYWEAQLGRDDFSFGQFGENFTVAGLPGDEVCIGDRYRIGSALFEVTQPRVTCYRVGIKMEESAMAALLVSHHRPGFYFRVLEEGDVGAGDEITKVADGPERITVADVDALLYLPNPSREQLERSLRVPALSQGWKTSLKAIVEQSLRREEIPGSRPRAARHRHGRVFGHYASPEWIEKLPMWSRCPSNKRMGHPCPQLYPDSFSF
jgi:MOSC domain-containing protein YiiM